MVASNPVKVMARDRYSHITPNCRCSITVLQHLCNVEIGRVRIPPPAPIINMCMIIEYKHIKSMSDLDIKNAAIDLINEHFNKHDEVLTYTKSKTVYGVSVTELFRRKFGWTELIKSSGFQTSDERKKTGIYKRCSTCNVQIYVQSHVENIHNFCSRSCAATFNNKERGSMSDETKIKISNKAIERNGVTYKQYRKICKMCSVTFWSNTKRTFCSDECRNTHSSIRQTEWLKNNPDQFKKFRFGRSCNHQSYMEQSFELWLNGLGIVEGLHGYLKEVHFFNKLLGKNGWIDFVFPAKRLIVELDGTHHRSRKELDDKRDEYLTSRGWDIIRISQNEYRKGDKKKTLLSILTNSELTYVDSSIKRC